MRLLFQPAEEGGAGGRAMVAEGALEGVAGAHAIHVWARAAFWHGGQPGGPPLDKMWQENDICPSLFSHTWPGLPSGMAGQPSAPSLLNL